MIFPILARLDVARPSTSTFQQASLFPLFGFQRSLNIFDRMPKPKVARYTAIGPIIICRRNQYHRSWMTLKVTKNQYGRLS